MVNPDVVNNTFFAYYRQFSKPNLMKLLLRAKQLYEARSEATKILKLVTEIEYKTQPKQIISRILQEDKEEMELTDSRKEILTGLTILLSRALTEIITFQTTHHMFKKDFIFRKTSLVTTLYTWGLVVNGYLLTKNTQSMYINKHKCTF